MTIMNCRTVSLLICLTPAIAPAATIFWTLEGDGDWETAANWSTGTVPTSIDDVFIDPTSIATVTINAPAQANQLQAEDPVTISTFGSLTIFDFGEFNSDFLLGDNTTFSANGASVSFNGVTNFDGGNLSVSNAGFLEAPTVTSYAGGTAFVANTLQATDSESTLDLSALTTMKGNTAPSVRTQVFATNGGYINLSSLMTVTDGRVRFVADGDGSTIDLTSFESLNHTGNLTSEISALNGGSINLAPSGVDLVTTDLNVDSTSFLDFAAIENYNGGTATIDGLGASFSSLVNADGTGFVALNSAIIDLGTLTDYNGSTSAVTTFFQADGIGSSIIMDQVTTITGNTFASARTNFEAINGGLVDLFGLQTIDGGATDFFADGADSLIDLSSVTSITNNNNINGIMEAINGGEIRFTQSNVTVSGVDLLIDGTGILDHSAFSEWRDGTIAVAQSSENFSSLTNINGSSILTNEAAAVAFPNISTYSAFTGFRNTNITAHDSSINLSSVTSLTGGLAASTRLNIIAASSGTGAVDGQVDLSSLSTINPSSVTIAAYGDDSVVKLNSLTNMTHSGNVPSSISASDGGLIDIGSSSATFTNVNVYLDTNGVIRSNGFLTMEGGTFGGNGTLESALTLRNGVLSPGSSAGTLGTSRRFDIDSGTVYVWDLMSYQDDSNGTAGISWDLVTGRNISFRNGSELSLNFGINDPNSADPFWGVPRSWTIASAEVMLQQTNMMLQVSDFTRGSFDITHTTDTLFLNFTPVPEPQTYALFALGGGLIGLWLWRRRRR